MFINYFTNNDILTFYKKQNKNISNNQQDIVKEVEQFVILLSDQTGFFLFEILFFFIYKYITIKIIHQIVLVLRLQNIDFMENKMHWINNSLYDGKYVSDIKK